MKNRQKIGMILEKMTGGEAVGHYYEDFTRRVDQAAEYLKLTRTQYEFAKYPERELLV